MPMVELLTSAGALTSQADQRLHATLGSIAMKWERTPDTTFYRSLTWVRIMSDPPATLRAVEPGKPCFRIDVTIPAGLLTPADRQGLVADLTAEVLEAAELPVAEIRQIWVFINETPEGRLGIGGEVVHLPDIRRRLSAEKR